MTHPAGESDCGVLRLDFDRRLQLEFHGSRITSDAGLLAFRELDDALGLSQMAGNVFADTRTGRNSRHTLLAQFRQSVFGRLAGYEDVNDADRLGCDPAMRFIVGGRAVTAQAASTSQMGRFETEVMAQPDNLGESEFVFDRLEPEIFERPLGTVRLDKDELVGTEPNEAEIDRLLARVELAVRRQGLCAPQFPVRLNAHFEEIVAYIGR